MGYTLTFEHPQFPEGHEFGLNNLGVVKNGGTLEIDEDQERLFLASNGMTIEDAFNNNAVVKLSGSSTLSADEVKQLLPARTPEVEADNASTTSNNDNSTNFHTVESETDEGVREDG